MVSSSPPCPGLAAVLLALTALAAPAFSFDWKTSLGSQLFVGGQVADISKAPSLVQIERKGTDGKWSFKCTGFLVKADHVVTAARCVGDLKTGRPLPRNTLRVRAGTATALTGGQTRPTSSVSLHPNWKTSTPKSNPNVLQSTFDVAVVTLVTPLSLGKTVKVAKLAPIGAPPAAETKIIGTGLALASATDSSDLTLRRAVLRVIPRAACAKLFQKLGGTVAGDQFCLRNGIGKAFCTTDAGAPVMRSIDGPVLGLFSWAWSTCGFYDDPAVVTDLTNANVRKFVDQALAKKQSTTLPRGTKQGKLKRTKN